MKKVMKKSGPSVMAKTKLYSHSAKHEAKPKSASGRGVMEKEPMVEARGKMKPKGLEKAMLKHGHRKLESMTPKQLGMHHPAGLDEGGESEG